MLPSFSAMEQTITILDSSSLGACFLFEYSNYDVYFVFLDVSFKLSVAFGLILHRMVFLRPWFLQQRWKKVIPQKKYCCYLPKISGWDYNKNNRIIFFFRIEWVRHCSFWKHLSNYFPVRIIKTAELDSEKGNYLLGSHPHGILCSGAFISLATEGAGWAKKFPNLVPNLLMLPAYFQVPGMREFMLLLGKTSSQTKDQVCCA